MWLLASIIVIWGISPGPISIVTLQNARKHGRMTGIAVAAGAALTTALVTVAALFIENQGLREGIMSSKLCLVEQLGASGIVLMGLLAGYKTFWPARQNDRTPVRETRAKRGFMQGIMS